MQHDIKLSKEEKMDRWLELCDFSYHFMKENLTKKEFDRRMKRLRDEHLEGDYKWLKSLAKMDKEYKP